MMSTAFGAQFLYCTANPVCLVALFTTLRFINLLKFRPTLDVNEALQILSF